MIDTGAGVSVVNAEFLERIQKITPERLKIYEHKAEIRGANNMNLGVLGVVYLKLRLGPTSFQHWCMVVDKLPYDLILGNDFIDEYGVVINIQKRLLLIPGQAPIRGTCKPNDSVILRTSKRQTIPARSRAFIAVTVGPMLWEGINNSSMEYMVLPYSGSFDDGIVAERQVHTVRPSEWFKIAVMNASESPIVLEMGSAVETDWRS